MKPNWFVALPVPPGLWFSRVMADLPSTCRRFHPEDIHLTIAFFGAMDPDRREAVIAAMQKIRALPFEARLGPILTLPTAGRVSALAFSLGDGHRQVEDMIRNHRDALIAAARARPDHRRPLAHLTIARPIRKFGERGKREARTWAEQLCPPDVSLAIERLALYTWSEDRKVRQFRRVHTRAL